MAADEELLAPRHVAALYRVDPKSVPRRANSGRLVSVKTAGGHNRFPRGQFAEVIDAGPLMLLTEVAAMFQVATWTVTRWTATGKLTCILTPGGMPRWPERQFDQLLGREVAA